MPTPLIAIIGAPNAGKSTLFNRLLRRRKALVHEMPGMTRDLNEQECAWDGRRVRLLDTGGLFPPGVSPLNEEVERRVVEAARQADAIILLVDGRAGLTPMDREMARIFRVTGRAIVVAVNKIDAPHREERMAEFHALGFEPLVPISAEHGLGIGTLREAVSRHLPPETEAPAPSARASEVTLAIGGRPNVGKSSLLNRLLREDRAIVSEVPGTTRDAVDSLLERDGKLYRIFDTAGLRRKGRVEPGPEGLSAMTARRHMETADVALVMIDAVEGVTQQDLHVVGVALEASRPFIVLLNKADLLEPGAASLAVETARRRIRFAPYAPIEMISARTGSGVDRILPRVDDLHAQACRRLTTGRLNAWLRKAMEAHAPPSSGRREVKFYYAVQSSANPPRIVLFGNVATPPHFSYQRYLENSLREHFSLPSIPVVLTYRQRARAERTFRTTS